MDQPVNRLTSGKRNAVHGVRTLPYGQSQDIEFEIGVRGRFSIFPFGGGTSRFAGSRATVFRWTAGFRVNIYGIIYNCPRLCPVGENHSRVDCHENSVAFV